MNINFNRPKPVSPPVESITIVLNSQESQDLFMLLGNLSRNHVMEILRKDTSQVDRIRDLAGSFYHNLYEEGFRDSGQSG